MHSVSSCKHFAVGGSCQLNFMGNLKKSIQSRAQTLLEGEKFMENLLAGLLANCYKTHLEGITLLQAWGIC